MEIDRRKYLYRIKRLEIKSWLKYLMIEGKHVVDYVLGELTSGTDITIDNTVEKTFYKLDVKGNSVQDGTPTPETEVPIYSAGDENLFDGEITTGSIITSTGTLSPNALGWYSTNFYEVKPNTSYTVSYNSIDYSFGMRVAEYTANKTFSTRINKSSSPFTFTTGNDIYFVKLSGGVNDSNIQLKATVGTISEKIVNKNLFDYANATIKSGYAKDGDGNEISTGSGNYTTSYTKVMPNTTYTFSADLTSAVYRLYFYDKNKNWISRTSGISNSNKHYTFTTPNNCYYIQFQNVKTYATNDEAQLELGSTATTYVAHQEQTYTIPVQQPMRSIGTVRDEFIKVNGNWFERHNIEHNIIKSENYITVNTYGTNSYRIATKVHKTDTLNIVVKSNYFIGVSFNNRTSSLSNIIYADSTTTLITVRNTDFTTLEDFKTWLDTKYASGNPVYIDYVLDTPVDLPCTEEQIAILENLPKSYNEQTNIYSLDVTPAYVEAQAYVKKEEE